MRYPLRQSLQAMLCALLLTSFSFSSLAAETAPDKLYFPHNGFSMAPLEGHSNTSPHYALMMFLPATEGFAPNVQVQIQPYSGSLQDYIALSRQQFTEGNLTVLNESLSETGATWEYTGSFQQQNMHWYSRAETVAGRVYLVTATARASQWQGLGTELKACVDSFQPHSSRP